ncbi:hypothetical protein O9X81_05170 [Agrobacterium salinitolerans]|uniref:hypothetical protein n=1 Tax=Agrobacterium salinitolerans TaxID=1183413 RepID=UPI0022B821F1|nr:hypothetical protein [Agrobacterium salinitolerans]MCZ7855997.1 hypothetical protein [Agrobacterium salinitolerans]
MSVYVQRDEGGVVVGLYANFQTGIAEELLEDDDPEVVAFQNPPEVLPPITKRQLRLTLVRNGISLETVEAAIASMAEGLPKAEAQIEWADASTFNRDHPTLLLIAAALGLTEAQVDAMWREAVTA